MGSPKTYMLLIALHIIYMVTAQEVARRIPQGFLGMRGKKYYQLGDNDYHKRRPYFFVGVKGKKDYDLSYENDFKRAPMGFLGMRGKKEYVYPQIVVVPDINEYASRRLPGYLVEQMDYTNDDVDLHVPEYPGLNDELDDYLLSLRSGENDNNKDKNNQNNKNNDKKEGGKHDLEGKFVGSRGKKDTLHSGGAQEIRFLMNSPWPKRRMQTGFLGVRGKKSVNDDSDWETDNEMMMPN